VPDVAEQAELGAGPAPGVVEPELADYHPEPVVAVGVDLAPVEAEVEPVAAPPRVGVVVLADSGREEVVADSDQPAEVDVVPVEA